MSVRRRFLRKFTIAFGGVTLMLGGGVAYASHQFTDVPTAHGFHADIDWLSDRSITGGCGGGNYCPNDSVTRGQMAAFLRRSANILSPSHIRRAEQTGVTTESCVTPSVGAVTFERTAKISSNWSIERNVTDNDWWSNVQYSTNGGAAWINASSQVSVSSAPVANNSYNTSETAVVDLAPGTSYMFRLDLASVSTVGLLNGQCEIFVTVSNRQPGVSNTDVADADGTGLGTEAGDR